MDVLNFTQHNCTQDQLDAGILEFPAQHRQKLSELLTFDELPASADVWLRATQLTCLFERVAAELGYTFSAGDESSWLMPMIGGAPFLMPMLELALHSSDFEVCYAFSRRESVEQVQPDGTVRKVAVFRHVGLVHC